MEQRDNNQCGENIKKKSIIAQLLQIQLFAQRYCHVSLGFNNQLFIAKILSLL